MLECYCLLKCSLLPDAQLLRSSRPALRVITNSNRVISTCTLNSMTVDMRLFVAVYMKAASPALQAVLDAACRYGRRVVARSVLYLRV